MSWTRFKDLVERHQAAAAALQAPAGPENADARRQVARAGDRYMEVLRLFEEERLGAELPNWTEYAIALARRRSGAAVSELFGEEEEIEDAAGAGRVARKSARTWPLAERVAPAAAALVDWDPGDLPIVPVLLDLPDTASRDALRLRAILGETSDEAGHALVPARDRVAARRPGLSRERNAPRERQREVEQGVRAAHGDALEAVGVGEVGGDPAADDGRGPVARLPHGLDAAVVERAVGIAEGHDGRTRDGLERGLAAPRPRRRARRRRAPAARGAWRRASRSRSRPRGARARHPP